jgi:hypothetical protein
MDLDWIAALGVPLAMLFSEKTRSTEDVPLPQPVFKSGLVPEGHEFQTVSGSTAEKLLESAELISSGFYVDGSALRNEIGLFRGKRILVSGADDSA